MGFTLWFTGLSGAGKSTLAMHVYLELRRRSMAAELLDGDLIRTNFSSELGFSRRDRDINVRRIGFVSHLLNKNKVASVVAAIAPYAEAREQNRALIESYLEVHVDCPLAVAEERDVKGLYAKARAGEIPNFTGVSDPYEIPQNPEIVCHTDTETVTQSVRKVLGFLEENEFVPLPQDCCRIEYSGKDEQAWRERLASLGYARLR